MAQGLAIAMQNAPITATATASDAGDACRQIGTAHPEAQERRLLPGAHGAKHVRREGTGRGHAGGVSTRSVDQFVKAMGMTGISKSQVSRMRAEIDERAATFLERPIEGHRLYLWLDATHINVHCGGRIVLAAVIVAVGANTEGRPETPGLTVGPSEAESLWMDSL